MSPVVPARKMCVQEIVSIVSPSRARTSRTAAIDLKVQQPAASTPAERIRVPHLGGSRASGNRPDHPRPSSDHQRRPSCKADPSKTPPRVKTLPASDCPAVSLRRFAA